MTAIKTAKYVANDYGMKAALLRECCGDILRHAWNKNETFVLEVYM